MAVMLDREISSGSLHRWVMEGLQGRAWEDSSAVLARQYQQARGQKWDPSHLASSVRPQKKLLLLRGKAAVRGHCSGPHSSARRWGWHKDPLLWSCLEHPWMVGIRGITWGQAHSWRVLAIETVVVVYLPRVMLPFRGRSHCQPKQSRWELHFPAPSSVCAHMTGSGWCNVGTVMRSFRLDPWKTSWCSPLPLSFVRLNIDVPMWPLNLGDETSKASISLCPWVNRANTSLVSHCHLNFMWMRNKLLLC